MRAIAFWTAAALFVAGAAQGASSPAAQTDVALTRLSAQAPGSGFQVLRSDVKGRLHLLTEELVAFKVTTSGTLEQEATLTTDTVPARPLQAALSADGSTWLLATQEGGLVEFDGSKGVPLPSLPMPPTHLAFLGSDPVFGSPLDPDRRSFLARTFGTKAPYLLRLSGSDWEPVLSSGDAPADELQDLLATSLVAAPDSKSGRLWVATVFAFEVRKLSAAGKELLKVSRTRLRAPDGVDAEREAELHKSLAEKGIQAERVTSVVVVPDPVVRAITIWAGDAYLLVDEPKSNKLAIYRVHGDSGDVDRVGLEVESPRLLRSMGATDTGLVIAGARAQHGLWSVPWSALEPQWKTVPEESSAAGAQDGGS